MKKIIALTLTLSLLLLSACAGSNDHSTTAGNHTASGQDVVYNDYPGDTGIEIGKAEEVLPAKIFTTTGEENGLTGTLYVVEGEVIERGTEGAYPYFIVSTDGGDAYIIDYSEATAVGGSDVSGLSINLDILRGFYPLPEVGENVHVFAEYGGMSGKTNYPTFHYGSYDYLLTALMRSASISTGSESTSPATDPTQTEPPKTDPPATAPPVTTVPEETTKPTESGPTANEKSALKSANAYLRVSAFSHQGLIDQLEYEGYTTAEATYAANNCGADWNEQALKSAKSYLRVSAFSYSGLVEQLEYENFTAAQAKYGVDNCGADWNAQAKKSAASYLSIMSFTRNELISQLEHEGFTHDQSVYGVEANGL